MADKPSEPESFTAQRLEFGPRTTTELTLSAVSDLYVVAIEMQLLLRALARHSPPEVAIEVSQGCDQMMKRMRSVVSALDEWKHNA